MEIEKKKNEGNVTHGVMHLDIGWTDFGGIGEANVKRDILNTLLETEYTASDGSEPEFRVDWYQTVNYERRRK